MVIRIANVCRGTRREREKHTVKCASTLKYSSINISTRQEREREKVNIFNAKEEEGDMYECHFTYAT
jgi:hypothetical protein